MRKRLWHMISLTFIFIVTFILGNAIVSFAVDPPGGSYKKTCDTIVYDGTDITSASCKQLNGVKKDTSLSGANTCAGIENCNGNLRCTGGVNLPAGTYRKSCTCCTLQDKLSGDIEVENVCCLCKAKSGKYQPETCTPKSCTKTITNSDGTIACQ
jgi:hypothetical protein